MIAIRYGAILKNVIGSQWLLPESLHGWVEQPDCKKSYGHLKIYAIYLSNTIVGEVGILVSLPSAIPECKGFAIFIKFNEPFPNRAEDWV